MSTLPGQPAGLSTPAITLLVELAAVMFANDLCDRLHPNRNANCAPVLNSEGALAEISRATQAGHHGRLELRHVFRCGVGCFPRVPHSRVHRSASPPCIERRLQGVYH